jgi:Brp/Blh family beta-carotene 15,15'-monooxygenase
MSKEIFIFLAATLLMLPVLALLGTIPIGTQLLISAPFIFLLGIPHGAIDNVLYLKDHSLNNTRFLSVYSGIILLNVLLWIVLPALAYAVFLAISAYHFGQSQFTHHFKSQTPLQKLVFISWGITVVSALILFNFTELQVIAVEYEEFAVFDTVHHSQLFTVLFTTSIVSFLGGMAYLVYRKDISFETLFMELIVLGIILFSFYLMPVIIGFTLYFVILHSLKVLREEYQFLKKDEAINSVVNFVKLLAPFSLISVLGLFLLFGLIELGILPISFGYCILIMISSITLPHVFVMNRFYGMLFSTKFYYKN